MSKKSDEGGERDQASMGPVLAFRPPRHVPDQKERRDASDPRWNVALEASAGTGKTSVLVSRYVRLVEEGVSPRHILAITFTRKAAAEMKARILAELRARQTVWSQLRDRLFEIHVTTIDAFCLGLLREFPLEAGLDPDIELIDDVDAQRLMEQVVEEALTQARRDDATDLAFLIESFGENRLRRALKDFLQSRLVRQDVIRGYVSDVLPNPIGLRRSLLRASGRVLELFRNVDGVESFVATGPQRSEVDSEDSNVAKGAADSWAHASFQSLSFALRRAVDPQVASAYDLEEIARYFLTAQSQPRRRLSSNIKKSMFDSAEQYERHRDQVLALAPRIREIYLGWFEDKDRIAVRALARLYEHTAERYAKEKTLRASLDFTDILQNAVRLLERRGEFSQSRFRLESRYHHLLIDEFQDTNEMQWRLVRALIDSWGEGAGLVQEVILSEQAEGSGTGLVSDPTIFIVGDRKQSIYGFRDARLEVVDKASREILRIRPRGARRLKIRKSFRAVPPLLHFVNDLFHEMPKTTNELSYSFQYTASDHFPVDEPAQPAQSEAALGIAVTTERSQTAFAIAREIQRLIESESVAARDIAILFRSRTHYRVFEQTLNALGVPTHVYRGLGFFDAPEVRDIKALVRFLAEPGSELRSAELARSRIVGLSDDGLFRLVNGGRRHTRPIATWLAGSAAAEGLPLTDSVRRRVRWACERVPRWVARTDLEPASELIQSILDEVDYAGWFYRPLLQGEADESAQESRQAGMSPSVGESHVQGWENLKKIMELVRKAHNRGYLTMARLAQFLDKASLSEESLAVIEAAEAVHLMTIHASKGLEFDTVFLVNMEQRAGVDRSLPNIHEANDGTIEIHAIAPRIQADTPQPSRALEEEKRLLYVAATRAKTRLVLSATIGDGAVEPSSPFGLLPASLQRLMTQPITHAAQETAGEVPLLNWESRTTHRLRQLPSADTPKMVSSQQISEPDCHRPNAMLLLDPLSDPADTTMAPSTGASGETLEEKQPNDGEDDAPPEQMPLF